MGLIKAEVYTLKYVLIVPIFVFKIITSDAFHYSLCFSVKLDDNIKIFH